MFESWKKPKLRDVDTGDRVQNLRALTWSGAGGVMGAFLLGVRGGLPGFILGFILGTALTYFGSTLLAKWLGSAGATVYMASGSSTPHKREYSLAESLAVRGQLEAAVQEYERCIAAWPEDFEPRLRLARLLRDRVQKPEDAAHWFRETLAVRDLEPQNEIAFMRELIELYTHRMRQPARALPVLAQLVARHPNSPAAAWARTEMTAIRSELHG